MWHDPGVLLAHPTPCRSQSFSADDTPITKALDDRLPGHHQLLLPGAPFTRGVADRFCTNFKIRSLTTSVWLRLTPPGKSSQEHMKGEWWCKEPARMGGKNPKSKSLISILCHLQPLHPGHFGRFVVWAVANIRKPDFLANRTGKFTTQSPVPQGAPH